MTKKTPSKVKPPKPTKRIGIDACMAAGCAIAIELYFAPVYREEWGMGAQVYKMEDNHVLQSD